MIRKQNQKENAYDTSWDKQDTRMTTSHLSDSIELNWKTAHTQ